MSNLVQLSGIRKTFGGIHALKSVDFDVRAGEVHALLGENGAGKSTLMRVLGGDIFADGGSIKIDGAKVVFHGPADAKSLGIQIIHQELALAPDLSVAENIYMAEYPALVSWRKLNLKAKAIIEKIGYEIDPSSLVRDLTIAHQQIVEVAKALSKDARVIVFDEPTAVLSGQDAQRLHEIISQLRNQGVGIVYISHRLDEVLEIADRMTILKDGATVGTVTPAEAGVNEVVRMMVGRSMESLFPDKRNITLGDEILRVENLSRGRYVKNADLVVRAGEIVGLGGLVGSGRTELARLIFGADQADSGAIHLHGKITKFRTPGDAVKAGVGLVPEDRKGEGAILEFPISTNVTMANLSRVVGKLGFIKHAIENRDVTKLGAALSLKSGGIHAPVGTLSGGNQQKVVLAKWLYADSELMIFDEPTRGVDVGAKSEIYSLIYDAAESGKAVIVISSEHQELFGLCDRIVVMGEGEIKGELKPDNYDEEKLLHMAISKPTTVREKELVS